MKGKVLSFIHNLIFYDYILFGAIFTLFMFLIILAVLVRRKIGLAIFLVIFSFVLLFFGPIVGYLQMHKYLYKNTLTLKSEKRLTFTDAIVVKGSLKNDSKFNFSSCKITAVVVKRSTNSLKNYLFSFKPLQKMSIVIDDVPVGVQNDFKIIVEPFTYKQDYNISLEADCR